MTPPPPSAHRPGLLAALLALALSGCSSGGGMEVGVTPVVAPVLENLRARQAGATAAPLRPTPGFPGLDPALIAGRSDPMMGAVVPRRDAVAGLVPLYAGPRHQVWQTADRISITLVSGGVVTSTRGLGPDLHASDAEASASLIAAGRAGQTTRRHVYLDGLFRPQNLSFTCTVQPAGREVLVLNGRQRPVLRIDETCSGSGHSFTNVYWRDAAQPLIRQSTQWIGPDLGVIHLQRLID